VRQEACRIFVIIDELKPYTRSMNPNLKHNLNDAFNPTLRVCYFRTNKWFEANILDMPGGKARPPTQPYSQAFAVFEQINGSKQTPSLYQGARHAPRHPVLRLSPTLRVCYFRKNKWFEANIFDMSGGKARPPTPCALKQHEQCL
jgi:hypothetical protein